MSTATACSNPRSLPPRQAPLTRRRQRDHRLCRRGRSSPFRLRRTTRRRLRRPSWWFTAKRPLDSRPRRRSTTLRQPRRLQERGRRGGWRTFREAVTQTESCAQIGVPSTFSWANVIICNRCSRNMLVNIMREGMRMEACTCQHIAQACGACWSPFVHMNMATPTHLAGPATILMLDAIGRQGFQGQGAGALPLGDHARVGNADAKLDARARHGVRPQGCD